MHGGMIFAEDIRQEMDGRHSILGVYPGHIKLDCPPPAMMARLAFMAILDFEKDEKIPEECFLEFVMAGKNHRAKIALGFDKAKKRPVYERITMVLSVSPFIIQDMNPIVFMYKVNEKAKGMKIGQLDFVMREDMPEPVKGVTHSAQVAWEHPEKDKMRKPSKIRVKKKRTR